MHLSCREPQIAWIFAMLIASNSLTQLEADLSPCTPCRSVLLSAGMQILPYLTTVLSKGCAVVLWHACTGAFSIRRFGANEIDAAKQFLREKVGCTRKRYVACTTRSALSGLYLLVCYMHTLQSEEWE